MINIAVYNLLILSGAVTAFVAWMKGYNRYLILSILLFATSFLELYVQYLITKKVDFTYLYHAFAAMEYPVLAWFLLDAVQKKFIKTLVKISIPVFIITSLFISVQYYHFQNFPGLNIEVEGLLISILCTYILFNLEVKENQPILKNQYFWICSGILIFNGTTFFFNGVYTKVLNINPEKAMRLFVMINTPLNMIMYAFITTGILCLLTNKRPTIQ